MDKCDKIAAGVLIVIMMGLMFIFGAMSQSIYNRHTIHKMGLVIIELENKAVEYKTEWKACLDLNDLLIEDNDRIKQRCDEQIEKIAC
ncbi:MAG: hypothetical protein KIG16_04545 [Eubacteriales bacterium]|nr:hypothetical protein [Eubacteriales bacterium]